MRLQAVFKPFTVGACAVVRPSRSFAPSVGIRSDGPKAYPLPYYIMRAWVGALLGISYIKKLFSNT